MSPNGNAAGSDPIGGVWSGGVVELCLTFPPFHYSTLPLFHSSTHIATGKMPVVPVAHRMPIGDLMSGFEKPPPAPTPGKGAGYSFARMSGMLDLSRDEERHRV